jgi:hypothetical protein
MSNYEINLSRGLEGKKDTHHVGLIIKRIEPTSEQKHTGFVFVDDITNEPMTAHLAWKNYYLYEKNRLDSYAVLWLDFIDDINTIAMTTELRMIHLKSSNKMPYSIVNSGSVSFQNGNVITDPSVKGDGLTCATFVLCFLEQQGFQIIDRDTWIVTEEDSQWQADIVEMLKERLTPEYYAEQKESIGKVIRIRPEQIVGACGIFDYSPIEYKEACEVGIVVLEELDKLA